MPPEFEHQTVLEPSPAMDQEPAASDTIRQVAAEVLETMFFTEAELASCEHAWLGPAACARIQFEGSHFGEMLLGVSTEAVEPIAASFLGLDRLELTDTQRGQVIQELTNILCGAMLSHLWPESKLALSSPELAVWQDWQGAGPLHRCFAIPEGKLAISIRLIPQPPAATSRSGSE
jgi:hypothetical protein